MRQRPMRIARTLPLWYRVNHSFFEWLLQWQVGYIVEGQEYEPPPPYIIIANHASALDDPLAALAVRAPVVFMAKEELGRNPLIRLWIHSLGSFFVHRGEPDRIAMRNALRLLAQGKVLCLFPEGTRSLDGRLGPLRSGAAYLALKTGVPILPMALIGTHHAMPKGANWPRRSSIRIRLGVPLRVPRIDGRVTHPLLGEWTERFRVLLAGMLPLEQQPQEVGVEAAAEPSG